MRYSSYKAKYANSLKKLNFLNRFKFVFIGVAAAAVVTTSTLLGIKGNVSKASTSKNQYFYGEKIEVDTSALMNDYYIEYALKSSDEWSTSVPKKPGEYKARGVSKGSFGRAKYGKETYFEIVPRDLNLPISSTKSTYGESPLIELSEAYKYNLTVTNLNFEYGKKFDEENPFGEGLTFKDDVSLLTKEVKLTDIEGEDVTSCYNIISETKNIEFSKRDLTVYVHGASKAYDGEALSKNDDYEVSEQTPLAFDDELAVVSSPSITEVGSIANALKFKVVRGEKDKTAFYKNINVVSEKLEITKRRLVLSTNSISREYNGYALSSSTLNEENRLSFEVGGDGLLPGHHFEHVIFSQEGQYITNSNVQNSIDVNEIYIVDKDGNSVKDYYQFANSQFGSINIRKRNINVTFESASKTYDGTALTVSTPIIVGDFAETDKPVYTTDTSITGPGSTSINESFQIISNNEDLTDKDVTDRFYNVHVNYGILQVNKIDLYIETNHISRSKYNGYPLSSAPGTASENLLSYTVNSQALLSGHRFEFKGFELENKRIVDSQYNSIYFDILDQNDMSVLGENSPYLIHTNFPYVNIKKLDVYVNFDLSSPYYTGSSYEVPYTVSGEDIPDTDHLAVQNGTIGPDTGYYNFYPNVKIYDKDSACVSDYGEDCCYNLSINSGSMYIKKIPLVITTNSINAVYDGQRYSQNASDNNHKLTYSVKGLMDNHEFVVNNFSFEGAYIGYYAENSINFSIIDKTSGLIVDDFYSIYEITYNYGSISIAAKQAELSFQSVEKPYDGSPLDASYSVSGLLDEDALTVPSGTGSAEVGSYPGYYSPKVTNPVLGDVTNCYSFNSSYYDYSMEITQRNLHVFSYDLEKVYDGYSLDTGSGEGDLRYGLAPGSELLPNHEIYISFSYLGRRDVVNDTNTFYVTSIRDINSGADVTSIYNITYTYGSLKIKQRTLYIDVDEKVTTFNGNEQTTSIICSGLADGDVLNYDSGFMDAGVYYYDASFFDIVRQGSSVKQNYSFSSNINGSLTIEPLKVNYSVSANGGGNTYTKEYDGKPVLTSAFTPAYSVEAPLGYEFEISYTNIDTTKATNGAKNLPYSMRVYKVIDAYNRLDVTNSGNFVLNKLPDSDVYINITKRYLSITANCSVVYDGSYHSAYTEGNYSFGNLAEYDNAYAYSTTFNGSTSITNGEIDTTVGNFLITNLNGEDVTNCYYWDSVVGTTEVSKRELKIYFNAPVEKTYDGYQINGHDVLMNSYIEGLQGSDSLTFNLYGDENDYIDWTENTYQSCIIRDEDIIIRDGNGNDVKGNYNVTRIGSPTYKINKRNLDLEFYCNTYSSTVYDGYEHGFDGYYYFNYYNQGLVYNDVITSNIGQITNCDETLEMDLSTSSFNQYFSIENSNRGCNTSSNYNINIIYGEGNYSFHIEKRNLNLYTWSKSKIFDGNYYSVQEINYSGLAYAQTLSVELNLYDEFGNRIDSNTCKDVGKYEQRFENYHVYTNSHDDVTENYTVTTQSSYLFIYERVIYYKIIDSDFSYGTSGYVDNTVYLNSLDGDNKYVKVNNFNYRVVIDEDDHNGYVQDDINAFISNYNTQCNFDLVPGRDDVDTTDTGYSFYKADGTGYYFDGTISSTNKNDSSESYSTSGQNPGDNVYFVTDDPSTVDMPTVLTISTHKKELKISNVVNPKVAFPGNRIDNQEKLSVQGLRGNYDNSDRLYIGNDLWESFKQEYEILDINGYYDSGTYTLTAADPNYFNHVLNQDAVNNGTIKIKRTITHADKTVEIVDVTNCYNFSFNFSESISFRVL